MKAGNEIKNGWEIIRCPICEDYLGFDPKDPKRNLIHDCPGRPEPKELSNTEFCETTRVIMSSHVLGKTLKRLEQVPCLRDDCPAVELVSGALDKAIARLAKAEKKIKYYAGFVSPTSWRGVWYGGYDPAAAPDKSVGIAIELCPVCIGKGSFTNKLGCFTGHCSNCYQTGYVVVKKEKPKTATRDSVHAYCPACMRPFDTSIYKCCPYCGNKLVEGKEKT